MEDFESALQIESTTGKELMMARGNDDHYAAILLGIRIQRNIGVFVEEIPRVGVCFQIVGKFGVFYLGSRTRGFYMKFILSTLAIHSNITRLVCYL